MGLGIWTFIAFFIAPVSFLLLLFSLSGIPFIKRYADGLLSARVKIGNYEVSIKNLMLAHSFLVLLIETIRLRSSYYKTYYSRFDRRISILRHERNWWISAFLSATWLTIFFVAPKISKRLDNFRDLPSVNKQAKNDKNGSELQHDVADDTSCKSDTGTASDTKSESSSTGSNHIRNRFK